MAIRHVLGQFLPDVVLGAPGRGYVDEIEGINGSLWSVTGNFEVVHGFLDAAAIVDNQQPDIVLHDPAMAEPKALVVRERP